MLTLLFYIMMLAVFGRMIGFAVRAAWGITKIILGFVFLPLILVGLVVYGMLYVAFPILMVVGIIALIRSLSLKA